MPEELEGSVAVARAVAACRPQVVAAYPISPQTHIVEALSDLVRIRELPGCEYLTVESEFAALSACIGASAVGARAYTATASQGLLFMAEALFNASGLGFPIVMTVTNRAIGAPINIWNDHSDAMAVRDAGWVQLYASSNQEAVDLHVQAFALAERVSLPVMVCMDGFVLTHAVEEVDVPDPDEVAQFLPALRPRQVLDPRNPISIGAMVGPEAFTEVRFAGGARQLETLDVVEDVATRFADQFGRESGGLLQRYRLDDAEVAVVVLGSAVGAAQDVVDDLRSEGLAVGALGIGCYRPWPSAAVRAALAGVERMLVVERAFAPGAGGFVAPDVRAAVAGEKASVVAAVLGLGGRPVTRANVRAVVEDVLADRLDPGMLHFPDLDGMLAAHALADVDADRAPGEAEPALRYGPSGDRPAAGRR